MENNLDSHAAFEADVTRRFGIFPNFFRSARAAPELIEQLWGFVKAGYLDNPMPSLRSGTNNNLAHINLGWLLNRERDGASDGIRRHRELVH
jgi:hypothetical protein